MPRSFKQKIHKKAFETESRLCRKLNQKHGLRPTSSPYVSGDSFRAMADHVFDETRQPDPIDIKNASIVFVKTDMLDAFADRILPQINEPFILVTHNSDHHIERHHTELAGNHKIHRWFAQNALLQHDKIIQIPIGLENRWWHKNGIIKDFRRLASSLPQKKPRILYAFTLNTNEKERRPALEALKRCPVADTVTGLDSRSYRKLLAEYMFVASPPGNGIDCHRTWEALYLNTLPIMKSEAFYDGFPNLPSWPVNDWKALESLNEQALEDRYNALTMTPNETEYLWMPYWEEVIHKEQAECMRNSI